MNKEYLKKLSEGEHIVFFPLILDERTICEQAKTNIKYLIFAQTEVNQQWGPQKSVLQYEISTGSVWKRQD